MERLPGLGRQADWWQVVCSVVSLIGCHAVKAGVRTAAIVEIEIPSDRGACVWYAVVAVQIDLFVLHRPPKPLDEHVVPPRALAVHADRDLILDEHAGEVCPVELAALIGVDDLRSPMSGQSDLRCLEAERGLPPW